MRPLLRFPLVLAALLTVATGLRALPAAADIKAGFGKLDADHNGSISPAEWEQASFNLFRAADRNNDNILDQTEIQLDAAADNTFARADENRDRRLSVDEFMKLRRALFATTDIDHNDRLDLVEYELLRLLGESGWNDTNRNGRIDFAELRVSLAGIFATADVNHDGRLTADETGFMQPGDFAAIAKDGAISPDEFYNSYKVKLAGF